MTPSSSSVISSDLAIVSNKNNIHGYHDSSLDKFGLTNFDNSR